MEIPLLVSYAATGLGLLAFLPQTVKTVRTRQTKDLALGMYLVSWFGIAFWLIYGILLKNQPIIIINVLGLISASIIAAFKIKYK